MDNVRYSKADREHAHRALLSFAEEARWQSTRADATDAFFHGFPIDVTAKERAEVAEHPNVLSCFAAFMMTDFLTEEDQSIAGIFCHSKRALLLPAGGRVWLEEFVTSTISAYSILDVAPGSHCRMQDLLTGEECEVYDVLFSKDCSPGMLIAARVMPRGDGKLGLDGDLLPLLGDAEELREIMQDWLDELEVLADDEISLFAFCKSLWPFFFEYWFEGNYRDDANLVPIRVNGEIGEPGEADYWMPRGVSPAEALARVTGFEADGPNHWYCYVERRGERWLAGHVFARGSWLRLESQGRTSMKEMRVMAQRAFGGRLKHSYTRYEPPKFGRADQSHNFVIEQVPIDSPEIGVPPEHPEFQERARAVVLARHYGTWTQHRLPALEGRTPLQAAQDPAWRPRLLALIVDVEQHEREDAARRGPGARAFDLSAIRAELGFEVERSQSADSDAPSQ